MVRLDATSGLVLAMAVGASLSAAHWLNHLDGTGRAEAKPAAYGVAGVVPRAADGHYWADVQVNGRTVRMMVDTGATAVSLTLAQADRLGLALDAEDFTREVQTAAGPVRAAPVLLDQVEVAGGALEQVEALVLERGLPHGLLGMSYLGRLQGLEVTPTAMRLKP